MSTRPCWSAATAFKHAPKISERAEANVMLPEGRRDERQRMAAVGNSVCCSVSGAGRGVSIVQTSALARRDAMQRKESRSNW